MNDFFTVFKDGKDIPANLPLIVCLPGQGEAGNLVQGLAKLLHSSSSDKVLMFNADELFDYRSRRPLVTIDGTQITDISREQITLTLERDSIGNPYFLFEGFEPDLRWEYFSRTVLSFIHELQIKHTTIVHAFPAPVPHRKPTLFSLTGNRDHLIRENNMWRHANHVPANIGHLLEFMLQKNSLSVVSWNAAIPHFLAGTEYLPGIAAAVSAIAKSTGLIFNTDELDAAAEDMLKHVDMQLSQNPEMARQLADLDQAYENLKRSVDEISPLLQDGQTIPTAEELGAEFENFLANSSSAADLHEHIDDTGEEGDLKEDGEK